MQNSTCNTLVQVAESSEQSEHIKQKSDLNVMSTRTRRNKHAYRPHRSIMHLHGLTDPLILPRLLMLDYDRRYHSSITGAVAGLPWTCTVSTAGVRLLDDRAQCCPHLPTLWHLTHQCSTSIKWELLIGSIYSKFESLVTLVLCF